MKNYLVYFVILCTSIIHANSIDTTVKRPRVSIITSLYKGDDFIDEFLEDITKQTIFDECELIIINAASPGNEYPKIEPYLQRYNNIRYVELKKDPGLYAVWNRAVRMARAPYITNANIDDTRNPECLQLHADALDANHDVDIVYSDYVKTTTPHVNWGNRGSYVFWEVGTPEFSRSQMGLCIAGPQPMWRKNMHERYGYFSEIFVSSADQDMWCRAVDKGAKMMRVPGYSGIFYDRPDGVSSNLNQEKVHLRNKENEYVCRAHSHIWRDAPVEVIEEKPLAPINYRAAGGFTEPVEGEWFMPHNFCTAADSKYYQSLLKLIGSIHKNCKGRIGEIAVFNLGLSEDELAYLRSLKCVTVHEVDRVHPDVITPFTTTTWGKQVPGCYAFKPVVLRQCLEWMSYVLWIDAGNTILRPLDDLFDHIQTSGYFLGTIGNKKPDGTLGHPIRWGATEYVRKKFNLDSQEHQYILDSEFVMGNMIGVSRNAYHCLLLPFYDQLFDFRAFMDDGTAGEFGNARHDQALLSVIAYQRKLNILEQDHTQVHPMMLHCHDEQKPFYMTHQLGYVNEHTSIFHSRGYMDDLEHYKAFIEYR